MRIAAISDIHGNSSALEAVLSDIERQCVDQVVNLGDCFSGPLDAKGTAEILASHDFPTVCGNHDRLLVDRPYDEMGNWEQWAFSDLSESNLDWIRSLPLSRKFSEVLMCHATPQADDENWLDRRALSNRLVARDLDEILERAEGVEALLTLCGHTHSPRSVRLPDGRRIVNVGSVGCPGYLDTRMEPNFVHQTGAPDARYAIVEKLGTDWAISLRSVPYDASHMINLAHKKGASNWAHALGHGWFA